MGDSEEELGPAKGSNINGKNDLTQPIEDAVKGSPMR